MTDAELMRAIRTRLKLTVEALEELAELIREARRRNLSLAEFNSGMLRRARAVAEGKLAAELVVKFADEPKKLDALVGVPLEMQKRLANGETLPLVVLDRTTGDTKIEERNLRHLTAPQTRQMFREGRFVPPAEQRRDVKAIAAASKPHASPGATNPANRIPIAPDLETGHIRVGAYRIHARAFFPALKALGYTIAKAEQ
jgi:hypothetical protein